METQLVQLGLEELEYLQTKKSNSTLRIYRSGLRLFLEYYQEKYGEEATWSTFLDSLDANAKLPRRERRRVAETEINEYIAFLKKKEKADNSIRSYFSGVQNFLRYKGFDISAKFLRIPPSKPKETNIKHRWKLDHIKEFVRKATSVRDKTVILCLFQSGLSVGDLCDIDYGDIEPELTAGILPLYLHSYRKKTNEEFISFFGRDAVKYLKRYLETRTNLTNNSPLFTMAGSNTRRLTVGAIQSRFKAFTKELSFIKENGVMGSYSPTRPHSLRSAFRSQLTGKTDPDLIEFFMAHSIGATKRAYLNLPMDELRELYANSCEQHLAIEKTSKEELTKRKNLPEHEIQEIREAFERQLKELQEKYTPKDEVEALRAELKRLKEKHDADVILRSLHYYAKNHPEYRGKVKKELENWKE